MSCCGSKTRRIALQEDEIRKAMNATRFSQKEVIELRQRFYRMSNGTGRLRKEQFREHMGVLGMDTVFFLSDRIFSMLDTNSDGEITFHDFINYFDIITNGTYEQKSKMAFSYIDTKNHGYFLLGDLQIMINGIINSWSAVTGSHLNEELVRRVDFYIKHIFEQMNVRKTGNITFEDYSEAIGKNPNILEIFEFLNKGISETIKDEENLIKGVKEDRTKDLEVANKLLQLENQLDQVIYILSNESNGRDMPTSYNSTQLNPSLNKEAKNMPIQAQLPKNTNFEIGITFNSRPQNNSNHLGSAPILYDNNQEVSLHDTIGEKAMYTTIQEDEGEENVSKGKHSQFLSSTKLNFRSPLRTKTVPVTINERANSKIAEKSSGQFLDDLQKTQTNSSAKLNIDPIGCQKLLQNSIEINMENVHQTKNYISKFDKKSDEFTEAMLKSGQLKDSANITSRILTTNEIKTDRSFNNNQLTSNQKHNFNSEDVQNTQQKDSFLGIQGDLKQNQQSQLLIIQDDDSNQKKKNLTSVDKAFQNNIDELNMLGSFQKYINRKPSASVPFDFEQGSFNCDQYLVQKNSELRNNQGSETTSAAHFGNNQAHTSSILTGSKPQVAESQWKVELSAQFTQNALNQVKEMLKQSHDVEKNAESEKSNNNSASEIVEGNQKKGGELNLKCSMIQIVLNQQDDTNQNSARFSDSDQDDDDDDERNIKQKDDTGIQREEIQSNSLPEVVIFGFRPQSKSNVIRKSKYSLSQKDKCISSSSEDFKIKQKSEISSNLDSNIVQKEQNQYIDENNNAFILLDQSKDANNFLSGFIESMKSIKNASCQQYSSRKGSESQVSQESGRDSRGSENLRNKGMQFNERSNSSSSQSPKSKSQNVSIKYGEGQTGAAGGGKNGSNNSNSSGQYINIQNSKIINKNEFIVSKQEQNISRQTNNNQLNINISNNYFINHHGSASLSPTRGHTSTLFASSTERGKNYSTSQPTTAATSKTPSFSQIQSKIETIQPKNNLTIVNSSENLEHLADISSQNFNIKDSSQPPISGNGFTLKRSNSQASQGSVIFSQSHKSGFFKEYQSKNTTTQNVLSDPTHKQFVKNVMGMSNEQLKERVLTLYQRVFDIKESLKLVRRQFGENETVDEFKDPQSNVERNLLSIGLVKKQSYINSSHYPNHQPLSPVNRIGSSNNLGGLSQQHGPQNPENEFRSMRASTVVNVPKRTFQKNPTSKKKKMVFFGHQNWNLVLNMMMGVQMAIRSVSGMGNELSKLEPQDYRLKYYFELLPRRRVGEQSTFKICKFSDYAPQVFRQIRQRFGVSSEVYLKSIGPDTLFSSMMRGDLTTLSELTSTGKSGSFFYYSADGRFTLKTIKQSEFQFIKKILPSYHKHLDENPNTLIIRFYGLHKIKYRIRNSITYKYIYFIIMSNVFHTRKEIHERFDLKGSLFKRFSNDSDPSVAKKDQDFIKQKMKIQVRFDQYQSFMDVVRKDCEFFEQNQLIDYSMLLGLNYSRRDKRNSNDTEMNQGDACEEEESISMMRNRSGDISYHFGIIDILTLFNSKKKLEYLVKRVALGPEISTIPPQQYALRFVAFIDNCFDEVSKSPSFGQILNPQGIQSCHILGLAGHTIHNIYGNGTFSHTNLLQNQTPKNQSLNNINISHNNIRNN